MAVSPAFAGFPGWVVWLFIHTGFLTGYRNRFGAVLSWWFAFTRDMRRPFTRRFPSRDAPPPLYHQSWDAWPGRAAISW